MSAQCRVAESQQKRTQQKRPDGAATHESVRPRAKSASPRSWPQKRSFELKLSTLHSVEPRGNRITVRPQQKLLQDIKTKKSNSTSHIQRANCSCECSEAEEKITTWDELQPRVEEEPRLVRGRDIDKTDMPTSPLLPKKEVREMTA